MNAKTPPASNDRRCFKLRYYFIFSLEADHAGGFQEQDEQQYRSNELNHCNVDILTAEGFAILFHFVNNNLWTNNPANHNTGSDGNNWHENTIGNVIHNIQNLTGAASWQWKLKVEYIVAKTYDSTKYQCNCKLSKSSLHTGNVEVVHKARYNCFHNGHSRGYRCEKNHQEEHNAHDNTGGAHAFKNLWQGYEHEARAGSRLRPL